MKKEFLLNMLDLRQYTDNNAFVVWGDVDAAYIKSEIVDGNEVWKVYASDGTELAATDSREFAFVIARQGDLEPKSVH
jgi:hypothetical protein